MNNNICIVGLGYIGLPTAAIFAVNGYNVTGVDVNKNVVDNLNVGKITIEEPYLPELVEKAVKSGNLHASQMPVEASAFIICVPTPINEDKSADMRYVVSATESILPYLRKGCTVVLESTSPPGTVKDIIVPILEKSGLNVGQDLYVAYSPERVLPGRILTELVENNRIVGGINNESSQAVKNLYSSFVKGEIFTTDSTTAEMCKLMENTFRDVNIALANELAKLCENMGINAWEVIKLSNKHPRVNIHMPGPGVGGHCIAVDPWFIVDSQPDTAKIIKLSRDTNDSMPEYVSKRIYNILSDIPSEKKIIIMGATYKPNIDDIRESPIMELISILEKNDNFEIVLVDPHITSHKYLNKDIYEAAKGADLLVMAVNHSEFGDIDFTKLSKVMNKARILDTRNFYSEEKLLEAGFTYFLLGSGRRAE